MRDAPAYESSYIQAYDANNSARTLAGSFLQKSHELLENSVPLDPTIRRIVEVGAGTGHHLQYLKERPEKYVLTDGSDEMLAIVKEKHAAHVAAGWLEIEKQDATALTYPDHSFDRLIATHVLEHLPNPVAVLTEWNRVVRPGGIISIVLPCDPGLLWRTGRSFGPRRNAKKLGIAYDYLEAAEHINSIYNLVVFIRHHFESVSEIWYPIRLAIPDLNLFYVCHIRT
jgi:phosphatidylethanolamine/phosphatidyl-N-methylethanolamine N-methyltransferase